jgi:hypothetical protein
MVNQTIRADEKSHFDCLLSLLKSFKILPKKTSNFSEI